MNDEQKTEMVSDKDMFENHRLDESMNELNH